MENVSNDLLLCTKIFARRHGVNLRNAHARFNFFPNNRGLYIAGCSSSQSGDSTVGGAAVSQTLNQHSIDIWFDKLQYVFQWTGFAATKEFRDIRINYVASAIGASLDVNIDMPTPLINCKTIRWEIPLAKAGQLRVFFASNPPGQTAAIKLMERTSKDYIHSSHPPKAPE